MGYYKLFLITISSSYRKVKKAAYSELVAVTRTIAPGCDEDYVKKKIDILRGSYRREMKKIQHSLETGVPPEFIYR